MGQKSLFLAVGLIVFAVVLTILFIVSRVVGSPSKNTTKTETTNSTTIENVVPVNKIINDPAVYDGYSLAVNSQVSGWSTSKSFYFIAQSSGILNNGTKGVLLVIAKDPFQLPQDSDDDRLGLGENATVVAKGTVVVLNREQLQDALGVDIEDPVITLNNSIIDNWTLGPVLILSSVETTEDK